MKSWPPVIPGVAHYDPADMISARCTSGYCHEAADHTTDLSEGILDPIPPGLAGCIDLSKQPCFPSGSPIGRAQRLLFSEHPKEFLESDYKAPKFVS